MFKCSHFVLIALAGLVWALVGVMLMTAGVHHLMDAMRFWDQMVASSNFSLVKYFSLVFKHPDQVMTAIIVFAILVGYLKGHFALSKSVKNGVQRIVSYPNPSPLKNLYQKKYYALMVLMMGLGMFLRWLKLPHDLHGAIDLAIGSALLKGAMLYFRYAWAEKKGVIA